MVGTQQGQKQTVSALEASGHLISGLLTDLQMTNSNKPSVAVLASLGRVESEGWWFRGLFPEGLAKVLTGSQGTGTVLVGNLVQRPQGSRDLWIPDWQGGLREEQEQVTAELRGQGLLAVVGFGKPPDV